MSGWVPLFVALHIAGAVSLAVLLSDYHFVDHALYIDVMATGNRDSLAVANELGRLDALTLAITVLSIVIAVATILGFWFYRGVVDQRATDEVRERLPMVLDEYVKKNPSVFGDAVRANADILRAGFDGGDERPDFADAIATTIDAEDNGESGGTRDE